MREQNFKMVVVEEADGLIARFANLAQRGLAERMTFLASFALAIGFACWAALKI